MDMKTLRQLTAMISVAAAAACQQAQDTVRADRVFAPDTVVFQNCSVIPMTGERLLAQHSVVISGKTVEEILPDSALNLPPEVERIDCAGQYLLPGLVDTHVHIGDRSELLSFLRYGVTTVFNLSGDHVDLFSGNRQEILPLRQAVEDGDIPGPTILTSGQSLDGDPATGPFQLPIKDVDQARSVVKQQHQSGYDLIKVYDSLSPELHAAIINEASVLGLSVWGHVPEAVGIEGVLSSGQRVVVHAEEFYPRFESDNNIQNVAGGLAREIKAAGVFVSPNSAFVLGLIAQLEDLDKQLAHPDVAYLAPQVRVWWDPRYNYYVNRDNAQQFLADSRRKHDWLLPLVSAMHANGVPLLMGTDAGIPVALPGESVHDELDELIAAGLNPQEAIGTATSNVDAFVAAHMPAAAPFGTIRKGSRADLIMVPEDPLLDVNHLRSLVGVMAAGVWYERPMLTKMLADMTADFGAP